MNNIVKSWKTTLFGSVLFVVGVVTFFYDTGLVFWQSSTLCLLGVLFAAFKDPSSKSIKVIIPVILISSTFFSSCVTEQKCTQKYGQNKSIDSIYHVEKVIMHDTVIVTKADSITVMVPSPCDSTGKIIPNYVFRSSASQVDFTIHSDSSGKLTAECKCLEQKQTIKKLEKIIQDKNSSIRVKTLVLNHTPWYFKFWVLVSIVSVVYVVGKFNLVKILFNHFLKPI